MSNTYPTITQLLAPKVRENWDKKAFGIFTGGKGKKLLLEIFGLYLRS